MDIFEDYKAIHKIRGEIKELKENEEELVQELLEQIIYLGRIDLIKLNDERLTLLMSEGSG